MNKTWSQAKKSAILTCIFHWLGWFQAEFLITANKTYFTPFDFIRFNHYGACSILKLIGEANSLVTINILLTIKYNTIFFYLFFKFSWEFLIISLLLEFHTYTHIQKKMEKIFAKIAFLCFLRLVSLVIWNSGH